MTKVKYRLSNLNDVEIYFKWFNDPVVRRNSFFSECVSWEQHLKWFKEKIYDPKLAFYIFQNVDLEFIGQVRFEKIKNFESIVGVSVSEEHRGNGYGEQMLKIACTDYFIKNPNSVVNAYIKTENFASKMIFKKVGFTFLRYCFINNIEGEQFIFRCL
jgi:RimJ/RimL family protein N-acetyltransferase